MVVGDRRGVFISKYVNLQEKFGKRETIR